MTCGGCAAKVKAAANQIPEIKSAQVYLEKKELEIESNHEVSEDLLNKFLSAAGNYSVLNKVAPLELEKSVSFWTTYKPLLLIIGFIFTVTLLIQYPFDSFSFMTWMRYFMAGFFIVFSFFKFLNLEGFVQSYRMYDIVAGRWNVWGYIYPFVELGLGILYLINAFPFITNLITFIVLGVSSIGVIKSNLDKRKIQCACLGDVFNLPMSQVTIIEDVSMVLMAGIMLYFL